MWKFWLIKREKIILLHSKNRRGMLTFDAEYRVPSYLIRDYWNYFFFFNLSIIRLKFNWRIFNKTEVPSLVAKYRGPPNGYEIYPMAYQTKFRRGLSSFVYSFHLIINPVVVWPSLACILSVLVSVRKKC